MPHVFTRLSRRAAPQPDPSSIFTPTSDRPDGPTADARRWHLGNRSRGFFDRSTIAIIGSVVAILVMLLANLPSHWTIASAKQRQSNQPLLLPPTPYLPYLNNPASSPLPDPLLNQTGPAYWPQVATTTTGAGQVVYQLVYAVNVSGVGSVLEIADGFYNATLAQKIFTTHNCLSNCTRHVPIAWQAPTPIAVFGGAMIQADAASSDLSCIAVAATVAGQTSVFASYDYGAPGTWYSLTGTKTIPGASPHVLATLWDVVVTTLSPALRVASLSYAQPTGCWLTGVAPTNTPPRGLPFGAPPTVTGVIPFRASTGTQVTINGTGLAGVSAVKFGSVSANQFSYHAPSITATVPGGTGLVPVTVQVAGQWSAATCASDFQYGATLPPGFPEVFSVSPGWGAPNTAVTVNGAYFNPASKVYFGSTLATSSYVQPGVMTATAPQGNGSVDITVQNTIGTSLKYCGDQFSFQPLVSGLLPSRDAAGNTTQVIGNYFNTSSTVKFGSAQSSRVTYVSATQLYAKIPSGTGTVHVTVTSGTATSATSCSDLFTYGAAPAVGAPSITSMSTKSAVSGTLVTINGANFTAGATTILFGGIPAVTYNAVSTSQVIVRAPLGSGSVHVQAQNAVDLSLPTCNDVFTIGFPTATHQSVTTLGGSYSDALFMLQGNLTVVAGNITNSSIVLYHQKSTGWLFTNPLTVTAFSASNGSAVYNSIGGTSLAPTDPDPGQVAIAGNATNIFLVFTSNVAGRTAAMTVTTSNAGTTWQGPYSAGDTYGSVEQPQVVLSPAGYFYVGWVSGRGASWGVQEAAYASSGSVLIPPTTLPGANYTSGFANASFGLGSDAFARPFAAWDTLNSSNVGSVTYTAGFVTPATELKLLRAGFNDTNLTDYQGLGAGGATVFQHRVLATFTNLSKNLTSTALCNAQENAAVQVYENDTTLDVTPLVLGPAVPSCNFAILYDNSFLAPPSGPTSANLYLQVQTQEVMEGLGYGEFTAPTWLTWPPPSKNGPYLPDTGGTSHDALGNEVTINPATVNPNALWLNTTYSFAHNSTTHQYWIGHGGRYGWFTYCGYNTTSYGPAAFWSNVTVTPAHWTAVSNNIQSNSIVPSMYVTNLTPLRNGTWQAIDTAVFQSTGRSVNLCPAIYGFKNWSGTFALPSSLKKTVLTISGTYTTGLDPSPFPPVINSSATTLTASNDTIPWNNTVYAHANAWMNASGQVPLAWSNLVNRTSEFVSGSGFQSVLDGPTWNLQLMLRTANGGWNGSWWPVLNDNNVSVAAPFETSMYACHFAQLANPIKIWWLAADNITNLTSSAVTITWYSAGAARGWVAAQDAMGASVIQLAKDFPAPGSGNGTYKYVAELHGLQPWGTYNIVLHEQTLQGGQPGVCKVMYSSTSNVLHLQMPAVFAPVEADNPYDSVTHSGGGAEIYWQAPYNFTKYSSYVNGSLIYWNATTTSTYPMANLTEVSSSQFPGGGSSINTTYAVNLSGLSPNTAYSIEIFLNYSVPQPGHHVIVLATSSPYSFTYLRSTSGDGLTDAEKSSGWYVTSTSAGGTVSVRKVTASIGSYSTNGLVNDLVEKQFALDPRSLDTAGSAMLDTWNLTFDLGTNTGSAPACPSAFHCWYRNATNPFASNPYPGHNCPSSPPVSYNTTGPHTTVDDSSAYDACVLWQGTSALTYTQSLVQNETATKWVRATIGKLPSNIASGDWALTAWGKLSWGADPLSASTVHDGIADGYRVTPLGDTDVNVTITGWVAGNLQVGNGAAAFIYCISSAAPHFSSQQVDYSNYTKQVADTSGSHADFSGQFTVTFPVYPTEQYASLNVSLVTNTGAGGNQFNWPVSGSQTIDLANPVAQTQTYTGSSDSLSISWQPIPIYTKAPTAIIVPGDNSTLTTLPLGLQRYQGEQNFVLLEANLNSTKEGSSFITQSSLPWVNKTDSNGISPATYSFTVSSGLTNILVPRVLFMHSPLGQALLNGTSSSTSISSQTFNSFIQGSWSSSDWTARALGDTTHGTDYGAGLYHYIQTYSNSNQNCSSGGPCGGVNSNPNVESGTPALAVQGIFVLNVTSPADLKGLLAGLLLNKTGNFTNSIFTVTQYLPSFGLGATVLSALANGSQYNQGGYGPPISTQPAPKQWWQVVASVIWNAVSGVIGAIEVVWSAIAAAASYVADLVAKAVVWGVGALVSVTTTILKAVAAAIVWAFDQILAALIAAAKLILLPITNAISSLMSRFTSTLWNDLRPLWAESNASQALNGAQAVTFFNDLFGAGFLIAMGIATVAVIVLAILSALSVGASFVENLILTIITTAIVSILVWGVSSLIPVTILSPPLVSAAWWLYNATGGGLHSMLATFSSNCGPELNFILKVWGAELNEVSVIQDLQFGVFAAYKLTKLVFAGDISSLFLAPMLSLTFDTIGLILAVATFNLSGEFGKLMAVISLALGVPGLIIGFYSLFDSKASKILKQSNPMYTGTVMGLGLGIAATTIAVTQLALDC